MSARHPSRHALAGAVAFSLALYAISPASHAASPPSASRFSLAGTAQLSPDVPIQSAGNLRLQASLQAAVAGAAQTGSGYAIAAVVSPQSLVCTPDTIFMDGFDGD